MNLDALPIPALTLDSGRHITSVNPAMARLIGASPAHITGMSITQALRPRTPAGGDLLVDKWHPSAQLPSCKRIAEQEVVITTAGGDEVEAVVDGGYDRDEFGNLTGATLLIRMRSRGRRRPRNGIRVVSAVSHELRSPLTSIRGFTTLLLRRWNNIEDEERKMMLQQVDRDARRISRMITELLDIARLESGRLNLHRSEIDLSKTAEMVIENVRAGYPELEAEVIVQPLLPLVWADSDKVEQIFTNLVENACKYADPKGITIDLSADGESAFVSVSDQGPGIPDNDQPKLFQQFFHSTVGRPTGTGLGLWLTRGFVEAHGGRIQAISPGDSGGATFRFTLPLGAFEDVHGGIQR